MWSRRLLLPSRQLTARLRPSLAQSRAFRPLIPYKSQQQTTPDPKRNAQQPGQQPQDQNQQEQLKQQQNQQGQQNEANQDGKPALSQENTDNTSSILHDTDPATNTLLAPVYVPEDPHAVLKETHPATSILANSGLVVQRQMEMMNVLVGFEQANKYVILDAHGNHVGYMAEQDDGIGKTMMRQIAGTHRSVVTWVFDRSGKEVLRFHRPFSFINSRIRVYDPVESTYAAQPISSPDLGAGMGLVGQDPMGSAQVSQLSMENMRVVGEAHQVWNLLRRKYSLFLFHESPEQGPAFEPQSMSLQDSGLSQSQQLQIQQNQNQPEAQNGEFHQFAYIDEPFMSWDFSLKSADNRLIGSVNRNFGGFAREIFTDTGVYAVRMDSAGLAEAEAQAQAQGGESPLTTTPDEEKRGMTLDQRAVMLATAVAVDFDYFSRHSNSHGGILPFPIPFFGWGGSAAEGAGAGAGAAGAEAGAAGAGAGAGAAEAGGLATGAGEAVAGSAAERAAQGMAGGMAGAGGIAGYEAMQKGAQGGAQAPEQDPQSPWGYAQPPTPEGEQQPFDERPWWEQDREAQKNSEQWGQEEDVWGEEEGEDGDWTDSFF